ncbi:MAG: hypothetical protein KDE55_15375 [Novosphingobium sp.]|nr:hypothetical protein [Novosphingobium sp.]
MRRNVEQSCLLIGLFRQTAAADISAVLGHKIKRRKLPFIQAVDYGCNWAIFYLSGLEESWRSQADIYDRY